ncbi:restriction endonuclease [Tetzosporium hominis]|uniref:Restriction endonuclease n=1 Tax=Tetzosporium hominis TaxID=2020506 RepID=A0A264W159_9BACL|nr:restriction endonuclease [Tetzosporium hominis]OZS77322.1 restriction endonuclease [Tetzosporium hominis]
MTKWWMVRAGDANELINVWKREQIASIGWPQLGDPQKALSKEDLLKKADIEYHESKPASRMSWVSQVWRFSREISKGDCIITYSKENKEYMIGTVTSSHFYDEKTGDPAYPNHIQVNWELNTVLRERLTQRAKNSLESVLTVFRVDDWGPELLKLLDSVDKDTHDSNSAEKPKDVEVELNQLMEEFESRAKIFVEDQVDRLSPWEMQDLVAALLQAMSYTVKVSPPGRDGGVDILASKDAFGFEKPIIKVQVKHRVSTSGSPEIQQLLGAHPIGASCLFVSTGGFTKAAKEVATQHGVHLLDLEGLVKLLVEWYEKMPSDARASLPLKKLYIPEVN